MRTSREIDAMVCWMDHVAAREGGGYVLHHTTRSAQCVLSQVMHRVDVNTLHHDEAATTLELNDIGRVLLRTSVPLFMDGYRRNRDTGSFVLIDETTNHTVAAGMILGRADRADGVSPRSTRSENVVWQPSALMPDERRAALGRGGATIWLTGLPASGKSTIAGALERHLVESGGWAYRLDGDNLRHGLNGDLGFDPPDRAENVRRTAHVARLLADAGVTVLVSLVSPYAADREQARRVHQEQGLDFLEIYVDTPAELCERRDPKGLYARARSGDLEGMTGVDAVYEPPTAPDLVIRPAALEDQIREARALLDERGLRGS
jgi:bifunctional enzyme CysN/CysC